MPDRIAILGAGPGGYIAAVRAAQLGADVTIIEEDNVGGTCLNWGCIPSKTLITTAELLQKIKKAESFGISVDGSIRLNIQRLMERKNAIIQAQTKGILSLLQHHQIRYLKGTGYLKSKGLAAVRLSDGGEQDVTWDKLILATGTKPFNLPSLPFDGNRILSSNDALCLGEVPESIVIVGGGVIGCEFAFLLSALGARVTIVEALSRMLPLPSVDEDCSKVLQREMKKRKINFLVDKTVEGFDEVDGKLRVAIGPSPFLENPTEKDKQLLFRDVDKLLVCIGRTPNTTNIEGFDSIGVQLSEKGWVKSNERMETTVKDIYAIGDLLGPLKIMLAHVASTEGLVAAENAMGGKRIMDYNTVPGAIFTSPEVANVGLTEAQAIDQGLKVRADSVNFRTLGKAQAIGEIAGLAKIVSEIDTGKILGVHIIGPHATDLIAEGTLAIQMGANVQDLAATIHAHPTLAEVMMETSLKAMDRSLHGKP
ncbi:MAG: dihydrolipoyl dehydrogenase [Desulfosarcina sp.]|nr:dihydrolipoyl dehydrogenase [Desulfosarcina sp.]MBC2745134.1 dihydrolipoyl dehydrogenase [Desulfosarcina sp.]MBC2768041.1 dihydrolipoyl dehydrogenase [Desulfosarcina sp.]